MGSDKNQLIFRLKLTTADTEEAKKEWDIARGYFCYMDYNLVSENAQLYISIVDFSIYIK